MAQVIGGRAGTNHQIDRGPLGPFACQPTTPHDLADAPLQPVSLHIPVSMLRYDNSYARTSQLVLEEVEIQGSGPEPAAMAEKSQNVLRAADPRAVRKALTGYHSLNGPGGALRRASRRSVG